jgi:phosphoribosylanthranilate isomerase
MVHPYSTRIDKKSWCFVNETPYYYPKVLKHDLQVVQLHGKESVAFVKNCEASCQKVLKL